MKGEPAVINKLKPKVTLISAMIVTPCTQTVPSNLIKQKGKPAVMLRISAQQVLITATMIFYTWRTSLTRAKEFARQNMSIFTRVVRE